MKKIVIASNNQGKINEFKQMLSEQPFDYEVLSQSEAGICIDVEETGNTFEENAMLKAKAFFEISRIPVISDDSGLVIDYLNGEPGIYSARYASLQSPLTQLSANEIILEKLEGVPIEKRTARFVCCICYMDEQGEKLVRGECEGYIGYENRGGNGFGYDPIFMMSTAAELTVEQAEFKGRSFAEISDAEKNKISHRGIALQKLAEELKKGQTTQCV